MMKPSDYNGIATGLNKLTEWADTLRAVFAKGGTKLTRTADGKVARVPDDTIPTREARKHPLFNYRHNLLMRATDTIDDVAVKMEEWQDDFIMENQDRADRGLPVTDHGRALFDAMSRFLVATDTPIPGAGRIYDTNHTVTVKSAHDGGVYSRDVFVHGVRTQCRGWVDRMTTWFPDLNAGPISGGIAGKTAGTIPGRSAPFVARLIVSDSFKQAVKDGFIPAGITTPPIPWNGNIKELATWLSDSGLLSNPQPDNLTEKTTKWKMADGVFTKDGEPVTNDQLKRAYQR